MSVLKTRGSLQVQPSLCTAAQTRSKVSSLSLLLGLFSTHLLMVAMRAARPTFVMEPQAEVGPVPVGALHVRPGGELIEFHLFHQERPWHGGATPTHTVTNTTTHTHKHSRSPAAWPAC